MGVVEVLLTILLFTDVGTIIPTSKKVIVTFHEYRRSWNEAQEVCETLGGSLYTEDSQEKKAVLVKYRADWKDPSSLEYFVWIGLHSLVVDGSYTWVYGKPFCKAVDPSIYSNWATGSTLDDGNQRCAHQYLTESAWSVGICNLGIYKFVCERQESTDCTFTESTGTPKSSLFGQFQTQACVRPDNTTCRDECLTSIQDDLNCWAAVYYSTTCVLYYMTDPFLFSDSGNIDPSSHQLFIKECYTSDTETGAFSLIPDFNADPTNGCTSIVTTTTSPTTPSTLCSTTSTTSSTAYSTTYLTSSSTTSSTTSLTTASTSNFTATSTSSAALSSSTSLTTPATTSVSAMQSFSTSTSLSSSASAAPSDTASESSSTTPLGSISISSSSRSSNPTSFSSVSLSTTSPNSSQKAVSSTVSTVTSNCGCVCNDLKAVFRNFSTDPEFANLTSNEILEKLILQLRVNKRTLSATIRRKTSATDNRPSAVSIGAVSAIFLATEFALFMAGDITKFAIFVVQKI